MIKDLQLQPIANLIEQYPNLFGMFKDTISVMNACEVIYAKQQLSEDDLFVPKSHYEYDEEIGKWYYTIHVGDDLLYMYAEYDDQLDEFEFARYFKIYNSKEVKI